MMAEQEGRALADKLQQTMDEGQLIKEEYTADDPELQNEQEESKMEDMPDSG